MESFCIIGKRGIIMIAEQVISPDFTIDDIYKIYNMDLCIRYITWICQLKNKGFDDILFQVYLC